MTSHIRIRCKHADSFRRAGIVFTRDGVDIDPNALDETQLQAIIDEPELEVVPVHPTEDDSQQASTEADGNASEGDGQKTSTEADGNAPEGDGQKTGTEADGNAPEGGGQKDKPEADVPKATKQAAKKATKQAAGKKAGAK